MATSVAARQRQALDRNRVVMDMAGSWVPERARGSQGDVERMTPPDLFKASPVGWRMGGLDEF